MAGAELRDGGLDVAAVHAALIQLGRQRPTAKSSAVMPGLDPRVREHDVVNQAHLGEPRQHDRSRLVRYAPATERIGELRPGPRGSGQ